MIKDINLPDIGDFGEVPVIEILVQAGDQVEAEQSLVTLERLLMESLRSRSRISWAV